MQRGKPLRRTELKRGDSQLKPSALKKRSKKMKDKYVDRRALVAEMLEAQPSCDACIIYYKYILAYDQLSNESGETPYTRFLTNRTVDIHELVNRSQGGDILQRQNLMAVCRLCHTRITTHPKEAEELGLHLESWCNTTIHFAEAERVRNDWKNGITTKPYWLSA